VKIASLIFLGTALLGVSAALAAEMSPILSADFSTETGPEVVKAARERGAASAAQDIAAGNLRILYYGKPWSQGKPLVDDATGYRVMILTGCIVSEPFTAEVNAYNDAMRAHRGRAVAPAAR
jgi:hypothetical protein